MCCSARDRQGARDRGALELAVGSARTRGAGAVAVVDEGGFTPLLFAARTGDAGSARRLLAAGADPEDTAPSGASALVVAAHSGVATMPCPAMGPPSVARPGPAC